MGIQFENVYFYSRRISIHPPSFCPFPDRTATYKPVLQAVSFQCSSSGKDRHRPTRPDPISSVFITLARLQRTLQILMYILLRLLSEPMTRPTYPCGLYFQIHLGRFLATPANCLCSRCISLDILGHCSSTPVCVREPKSSVGSLFRGPFVAVFSYVPHDLHK